MGKKKKGVQGNTKRDRRADEGERKSFWVRGGAGQKKKQEERKVGQVLVGEGRRGEVRKEGDKKIEEKTNRENG